MLGGQTYTTTVQDDLTWSLPLTQSQLTALGNGELTVSASVTNVHGNTGFFLAGLHHRRPAAGPAY